MAPHAAMVLNDKIPLKLFTVVIVYRPTTMVQQTNDALMVRCWKQITGTSPHTHGRYGGPEGRLSGTPPLKALMANGGGPGMGPARCMGQ